MHINTHTCINASNITQTHTRARKHTTYTHTHTYMRLVRNAHFTSETLQRRFLSQESR